jgi:hypothetical protein
MGVSDEAKNVIPLKFLRKIEKNFFFQWLINFLFLFLEKYQNCTV